VTVFSGSTCGSWLASGYLDLCSLHPSDDHQVGGVRLLEFKEPELQYMAQRRPEPSSPSGRSSFNIEYILDKGTSDHGSTYTSDVKKWTDLAVVLFMLVVI
jgi:hypothetical protein